MDFGLPMVEQIVFRQPNLAIKFYYKCLPFIRQPNNAKPILPARVFVVIFLSLL
jgi:hypothetical protein